MRKRIPKHITDHFGSSHAFRKRARRIARDVDRLIDDLSLGCAFFPCGYKPIERIRIDIELVRRSISVKEWGR